MIADTFDWWLLIGDEAALPSIGRRVESLREGVRAITLVAVTGPAEEQVFNTRADHQAIWVHRAPDLATSAQPVLDALKRIDLPPSRDRLDCGGGQGHAPHESASDNVSRQSCAIAPGIRILDRRQGGCLRTVGELTMTPVLRQSAFINTAHALIQSSVEIMPTAALAMAIATDPFGPSYGPVLALATGMFVFYGLLSLPQGWLAQRFGQKILMTAFFLGIGAGLIGAGLAHSPTVLAVALAFAGGFAAIYHPIGTTMLVEAAGEKPGRSIGVNGVFGNLGVALAPVVTAFLANAVSWRAAFIAPGVFCLAVGLLWMRTPLVPAHLHRVNQRPFPPIPRHLVRRAVVVLMLIAMASGLVFNAFTLLLPKLLQERLAGNGNLLHGIDDDSAARAVPSALIQFTIGRMTDRTH